MFQAPLRRAPPNVSVWSTDYGGYPDQTVSTHADFRLSESQDPIEHLSLSPPKDILGNTKYTVVHSRCKSLT